ncbi:thiol-disulfide isomerase/thioredoxin [Luteibacter rhizovicinus]|uniref:Thiol-disulfide isomerase/thioredoxin n=1 Tax=Luteibacter rhizovicinus TaxID=242606 RepID=A0A4V2W4I7_9GAMM|nr:TlpA disulfide reductase family protein [Luteibacter rhizovicinus]TCV96039.1 thiol-disulfide isomerase/thioredoxin [Luteibacter rhizovicinus]
MARGPTFWIVTLSVVAAVAGFCIEHRRTAPPPPPAGVVVAGIGDIRPDASYVDVDGHSHRLADWNGKRVLLNFWASWCAPCRKEMPLLNAAQKKYAGQNIVVVGVAEDTADDVRAYLAQRPVDYPIVLAASDAPGASLSMGNTRRLLPYSVLIGTDGRILKSKLGALGEDELDDWLGSGP